MSIQLLSLECQKDIIANILIYGYMSEDSDYDRKKDKYGNFIICHMLHLQEEGLSGSRPPTRGHICHDSPIRSTEQRNRKLQQT